jgi:phenylalanyl-tRNA synthetase beta chain
VQGGPSWMHPGRSATLQFGPQNQIGCFGELHPSVLKTLGADGPVMALEILLDAIPAPKARPTKMKPRLDLSELQPLTRDFAFLVDRKVKADDVLKAARAADRALIADVSLFDIYEGKGVAEGAKSLAIEVTLQPKEKTLTDAEIEAVAAKIVAEVGKKTGATLRG